jgi:hypothetical protein
MVARLVETLIESRSSVLGPDVRTLMNHYSQMLRRHIVSESEIAELCQKIYRKHQRALDLIYEYRPDKQAELHSYLEDLIRSEPALALDHSSKSYITFAPKSWDTPVLLAGQGWTRSGRIMLFEFGNFTDRLRFSLIIGPGPLETRQKLMEIASKHRPLKPVFKALGKSFNTIYVREWLKAKDYEDADSDELEAKVKEIWTQFLKNDLTSIQQIVQGQDWIWAGEQ